VKERERKERGECVRESQICGGEEDFHSSSNVWHQRED